MRKEFDKQCQLVTTESNNKTNELGQKFDKGKSRWGLLPFQEIKEIVDVLTVGSKKYGDDNWKQVKPRNRYIDALFRHLNAWINGEQLDPEDSLSHLAHAGCNLLFLMWFDNNDKHIL